MISTDIPILKRYNRYFQLKFDNTKFWNRLITGQHVGLYFNGIKFRKVEMGQLGHAKCVICLIIRFNPKGMSFRVRKSWFIIIGKIFELYRISSCQIGAYELAKSWFLSNETRGTTFVANTKDKISFVRDFHTPFFL